MKNKFLSVSITKLFRLLAPAAICLACPSCAVKTQPAALPQPAATNRPAQPDARIADPTQAPEQNRSAAATTNAASAPFYYEWTMEELLPFVEDLGKGRDFQQGKLVFQESFCGGCHAFTTFSQGTGLAPDLSSVGNQFTREFILQSLLDPSAIINGQYYYTDFRFKDGETVSGKVIEVVDGKYRIAPSVVAADTIVEVKEEDVASYQPSPVSPMPSGLLNAFTPDQILDLIAFLVSGGNPQAGVFAK